MFPKFNNMLIALAFVKDKGKILDIADDGFKWITTDNVEQYTKWTEIQ